MYCISITELTVFIFVGSISLPWSPNWPFYFLTLSFFLRLFDVALSGLILQCFYFIFLMLQGHHLGYITFNIQIKMDMAEPFCCCTEAKPVNLRVPASERQPPRLPH